MPEPTIQIDPQLVSAMVQALGEWVDSKIEAYDQARHQDDHAPQTRTGLFWPTSGDVLGTGEVLAPAWEVEVESVITEIRINIPTSGAPTGGPFTAGITINGALQGGTVSVADGATQGRGTIGPYYVHPNDVVRLHLAAVNGATDWSVSVVSRAAAPVVRR